MPGCLLFQKTTARILKKMVTGSEAGADLDRSLGRVEKVKHLIQKGRTVFSPAEKVLDAIQLL